MTWNVAALVLLGALCLVNLLLTVAVIRRLKEHTELLSERARPEMFSKSAGDPVGEFTAVTTAGETLSSSELPPLVVAAFFAPGCQPCEEQIPQLTAYAARYPADGPRFWAVVFDTGADPEAVREKVAALDGNVNVILEPPGGPVARAFGVNTVVPAFVVAGDGVVRGTEGRVDMLPDFKPAGV
ncbi:TlpA disulfide reductase family protein [Microtetraspora niveoalba]|uniref:TlpA disulfide reductase family protein n=1 Tax=Microtetraspora niveoalba TaxID=46175 RepID=UPI00082AB268|nr:TlpA disulfide reductase family protein [Microtetraspora niveoalba]